MAYKSFRTLTSRNQSSLITQFHKLINYYSDFFCPRERSYLKAISQKDESIYWLEDDEHKVVAFAVVDPNYDLFVSGIRLKVLSYTISRRPGQMDRIMTHIWSDYEHASIVLLCRKTIAKGLDLEALDLIELSPLDIKNYWPEFGALETTYFNLKHETMLDGLIRRGQYVYLRLSQNDRNILEQSHPELVTFLDQQKIKMVDERLAGVI